jgi:putative sterol carrier protein
MSSEARELLEGLPEAFLPEKAGSARGTIQFDLHGEGGGQWALELADGTCEVREETAAAPNVTLSMKATDFVAMYKGTMNPIQAFMGGKIKVSGNVGLVMQMLNWFDRG